MAGQAWSGQRRSMGVKCTTIVGGWAGRKLFRLESFSLRRVCKLTSSHIVSYLFLEEFLEILACRPYPAELPLGPYKEHGLMVRSAGNTFLETQHLRRITLSKRFHCKQIVFLLPPLRSGRRWVSNWVSTGFFHPLGYVNTPEFVEIPAVSQ